MTLVVDTLGEQLKRYLQSIESLENEKSEITGAIKETFDEAKREGIDVKALRSLLKMRKMDRHAIEEQETTLYNYMQALGMR
ncbi:MAG: DUF2312 domain-containing protein [Vulcanimicrobiota bacterium]